uniref:Uncharacterized protein n=1 Tax=Aegilops tauschii subsp. strangulata TaxID=200361 RepID=A0A453F8T9_AEGTS
SWPGLVYFFRLRLILVCGGKLGCSFIFDAWFALQVTCRARFFLPRTILSFASTAGGRASHAPTGAWRELLSTTPATGTWKTQSTVPPMNKAETSIVRIPVRMMLDLLLEHLGLHKAI